MRLNAARSELETAGERQRVIDGLVAEENKKLEALSAERAAKGRGRPNTIHSSKVKAAATKIARLMRIILPSEQAPYVPRTMLELVSSAAKHPQHHAAAGAVPAGRRSDAKRSRDADDDDDDDETSSTSKPDLPKLACPSCSLKSSRSSRPPPSRCRRLCSGSALRAAAAACEIETGECEDVVSRVSLFSDSTGLYSTHGRRWPARGLTPFQI